MLGAAFTWEDLWRLALAVFLVVFCALVFVIGLKLPIPLCPDLEAVQSISLCRA